MAKQDPNPPPWKSSMGDGCSGVLDWLPFVGSMTYCCDKHDEAFHFGGGEADFQKANDDFRKCLKARRRCWLCAHVARLVSRIRGFGVDRLGRPSFNWLGPGPPKPTPQDTPSARSEGVSATPLATDSMGF